ncbi:hypothetical protein RclHR1_01380015 [Rhizophagus clarus]|uniref:G patch domain and ankyrin repeat-containing protein 1 homolog n=1 Tax=Rhizophagus clarus TaxID=94130 RepID=A0A2Z6QB17_9GLOM|nr:hypothetical protein RclHR1_01380015 [Rhizophagus clarus]GET02059.1 G patch domain and ankyrin repeat-containing protein 1 homolog [Rhizophagus clarus]
MTDKIPYSLLRIPISFVPSNSLRTVTSEHPKEEDKEKLASSITKFYQSVISLPPTKKEKVRKNKTNITNKKQQGIINNKTITKDSIIENRYSQSNFGSTNNEFSNSMAKLLEYNDSDEEDIKHVESIEDTTKIIENNEFEGKFNSDDNKIWCADCEVWVEKRIYQDHTHGVAHLVSKSFDDRTIPDPLTLNETNVGFRMLRDQGWCYEKGLGINEQGKRHPISTRLKNDRFGIGVKKTKRLPKMKLKRLNAKQTAAQYEKDRRDRARILAYMNR